MDEPDDPHSSRLCFELQQCQADAYKFCEIVWLLCLEAMGIMQPTRSPSYYHDILLRQSGCKKVEAPNRVRTSSDEIINLYNAIIFDLEGTLIKADRIVAEIANLMQNALASNKVVSVLTNAAATSPQSIASKLNSLGVVIDPTRIHTPRREIAMMNRKEWQSPFMLIGGNLDFDREYWLGDIPQITESASKAKTVIILSGRDITVRTRLSLSRLASDPSVRIVVANPDITGSAGGLAIPQPGLLAAELIENGAKCKFIFAGKPFLNSDTLDSLIGESTSAVLVGDTIDTDMAQASLWQIDSVLFEGGQLLLGKGRRP